VSDPRLTPFSGRVAHDSLRGQINAQAFTLGQPASVTAPLADLLRRPGGPRDRQLLRGAQVLEIDRADALAYVLWDGYCGWVAASALGPAAAPTHWVAAPATHLYTAPDLKSPEVAALSLGAHLVITGETAAFLQTDCGHFVPRQHMHALSEPDTDPVAIAASLLGTPYLWGGNSRAGIDCSGLVQIALHAAAQPCPADSDLQERAFAAHALPTGAPAERGDLLFWRGHVAWVADPDTILHANAHTMSVAYEGLQAAIARIAPEGPVTAHIRLPKP
jgi:cell wall-associated NlpC family hydrolase